MKKVCFVCLGNICRSPMAEFVMKSMASPDELQVESRATSGWEHGNPIIMGHNRYYSNIRLAMIPRKPLSKSPALTLKPLTILSEWIAIISEI